MFGHVYGLGLSTGGFGFGFGQGELSGAGDAPVVVTHVLCLTVSIPYIQECESTDTLSYLCTLRLATRPATACVTEGVVE